MNKRKLLLILFFSAIVFFFMVNKGFAYSSGMRSVDQFRRESVDIYQLITFNYTVVGTGGESITAVTTIRSDGQLMEEIQANSIDNLGSENRIEIIPEVKSVWNQRGIDMLLDSRLNYTNAIDYWQRTFLNDTFVGNETVNETIPANTVAYLDLTEAMTNDSLINQNGYSGYRYQMVLLPPEDVATYWCQQNDATLNSIDNVNLSINMNDKLVDMLSVQISEEMEVDNNLADGYQPVPIGGDWAVAILKALFSFIIKIILIICAAATLITWAILDYTPFDLSTTQINNLDQSFHAPEAWNTSEEYQTYIDLCNASGTIPTVEGFIEYLRGLSTTLPNNNPTWNNNFTAPAGDSSKNSLLNIIGFIGDLMPLIITIIIVVAFVFAFIFVIRGLRSASSFISPKKKR